MTVHSKKWKKPTKKGELGEENYFSPLPLLDTPPLTRDEAGVDGGGLL